MSENNVAIVGKNWKRPFFLVWIGQAFSLLGSQLVQFALIWYLTKQTGSATVLATATLVGMLPQVLLGPIAGSIVDRSNRRRIMILADFGVAASTILLAVLFAIGWVQIWQIYAIMLVRSLGSAFHGPAFSASTSLMVPKEQLSRVQGFNQTLQGGLAIFSAPMGALLLELVPMQGVLAVDVLTAALAIGTLFFVAIPQPAKTILAEGETKTNVWQDMRVGFRYVLSWPGLLIVLVMATLINFLLTPAFALTPLLINKFFGGGAPEYASFEASFGLGIILGGLLLGIWGGFKSRVVTAFSGLVIMGVFTAIIGFVSANGFAIALGAIFATGVVNSIVNASFGATLQAVVDPGMQGRVFTLTGSASMAMTPLGLLVAGPLADTLGVQAWYIVGGVLCMAMGVAGLFIPSVMKLEAGRPGSEPKEIGEIANVIEAT
jgi:DHA3 family macrolide efflux protein-like MFS transporter